MNLCVDVGNTTINIGVFSEDKKLLQNIVRDTLFYLSYDKWEEILKDAFGKFDIKKVIYSSVVPKVDESLLHALANAFGVKILRISKDLDLGFKISENIKEQIGDDLLADLAYLGIYKKIPAIVVDLGTATKLLLLEKDNVFSSCLIVPGIALSMNILTQRAALLSNVDFVQPDSIYATKTSDAINAGVVYGHIDMINGLVKRYEEHLGYKINKFITGGSCKKIVELLPNDFTYVPELNLIGLNEILERNS